MREDGSQPEFGNAPVCPKGFMPEYKMEALQDEKRQYRKLWKAELEGAVALAAHVERFKAATIKASKNGFGQDSVHHDDSWIDDLDNALTLLQNFEAKRSNTKRQRNEY